LISTWAAPTDEPYDPKWAALDGCRRVRLGNLQLVAPLVQSWLSQWAARLSSAPEGVALAAMLLPITLAVFSKRLIVLLGCILLAVVSFCALVTPSEIAVTLATSAYLGSVIVAVSGIVADRRARVRRAEFARLRADVKHLLNDQQRRLLTSLKFSEKEGIDQKPSEREGIDQKSSEEEGVDQKSSEKERVNQNLSLHEPSGSLSRLPEITLPRPNPGEPHRSVLYFIAFTTFLFVAICMVMLVAVTTD
jgi:hypothetical protein